MKIIVNQEEVLQLSDTQKKVIQHDVPCEIFDEDMKRRIKYIITHKYEECFKRLKSEWEPKLKSRVNMLPTNDEEFAKLVFSQPDYLDRSKRNSIQ